MAGGLSGVNLTPTGTSRSVANLGMKASEIGVSKGLQNRGWCQGPRLDWGVGQFGSGAISKRRLRTHRKHDEGSEGSLEAGVGVAWRRLPYRYPDLAMDAALLTSQ